MKLWKKILIGIVVAFIGVIALAVIVSPKAEEFPVPEFTSPAGTEERVDEIFSKAVKDSKNITIENAKYCKQYLVDNFSEDPEANMYYGSILYLYGINHDNLDCTKAGNLARQYSKDFYLNGITPSDSDYDELRDALAGTSF